MCFFYVTFPTYISCRAENLLGRNIKFIEVSGKPQAAEIISEPWSRESDNYELLWKMQDYVPVTEVRIMYRKLQVGGWTLPVHLPII